MDFHVRRYPHVPCPGRGIVLSVECHVSLGNHPVKLRDQQHQTGLAQILRRTVGMIARTSTAKQFNMGKCSLWMRAKCARACQYEPATCLSRTRKNFQVQKFLLPCAVSFKTELAVLSCTLSVAGRCGWVDWQRYSPASACPCRPVVWPRRETSEEGGAPADLRPEPAAFSPCRHAARSREPGTE